MTIALPDTPHYSLQVVLEDVTYSFEFRWNTREQSWFMHLLTDEREPIAMGIKVVCDARLARRCRDPRRPPGEFVALDTHGKSEAPGEHDLGDRVQLIYVTSDEVAAL